MKTLISLVILVSVLTYSIFAAAQAGKSIEDQKGIDKIIKEKSYPGGVDEEPLKVIPELRTPYSLESFKNIQKQVFESLTKEQSEEDTKTE